MFSSCSLCILGVLRDLTAYNNEIFWSQSAQRIHKGHQELLSKRGTVNLVQDVTACPLFDTNDDEARGNSNSTHLGLYKKIIL